MKISERYPELEPLLSGTSLKQLSDLLFTLSLVRYANIEQLRTLNFKLGTKPKLDRLVEVGYLKRSGEMYFTAHISEVKNLL